jgi:tartrate/fumarate subfamily iron-sulfur-dependent hydro-lyase beta chain
MKTLSYPYTEAQVRALLLGEPVALSGLVFTGRDRLHKFLHEGGASPVALRDGALYHCGPVVVPEEGGTWRVVAAGPTTSVREEPYQAGIIARHGVRVVIGKGGMGAATRAACQRHGCVYLQVVGGAAVSLADRIRRVRQVHFLETFGATEALWELEVVGLEAVVAMDAHGHSLYEDVTAHSRRELERLLAR